MRTVRREAVADAHLAALATVCEQRGNPFAKQPGRPGEQNDHVHLRERTDARSPHSFDLGQCYTARVRLTAKRAMPRAADIPTNQTRPHPP
jgi:hypothetical protein